MITFDTEVLTPYGLIEAWKLFPGDELLDDENNIHEVIDTKEEYKDGYLVELEDESSFVISKEYAKKINLKKGSDLILDSVTNLEKLEQSRMDFQPVLVIDGLEFGNLGKYQSIPFYYTMNTAENRKRFFQGLLFSQLLERHSDDNTIVFLVAYKEFAEDVLYLVRSLGGSGYYHQFYSNGYYYEVNIQMPSYFNEGIPTKKVINISDYGKHEFISFEGTNDTIIINGFTLLKPKGDEYEKKHTT